MSRNLSTRLNTSHKNHTPTDVNVTQIESSTLQKFIEFVSYLPCLHSGGGVVQVRVREEAGCNEASSTASVGTVANFEARRREHVERVVRIRGDLVHLHGESRF